MRKFLSLLFIMTCVHMFSQTPTWSNNVAKLIYGNCTSCHRTGGIAPFPLESYNEVSTMANWINQSIQQRKMPPWTPKPEYKNFAHERVLSQTDRETFQTWVDAGTPSGDLRFAPPLPNYSNASQLGTPDLSLSISNYTITSSGDVYRNFVFPTGLTQATYAKALEIIPGNSSIVHHVLVFIDSTSNPIDPGSIGGTGSAASQFIYSWTPGATPYYTPVGTGFRIAPNSRIILQIHYGPGSLGQVDNTQINLKLTSTPQRKILVNAILNNTNLTDGPFTISANTIRTFNQQYTVPNNVTSLYIFPHMHLLGKSIRSWANLPVTNDTVRFIDIPDWDFHWQGNYVFPNSVILPTGSILRSRAVYDNTSSNPNNPSSPPQTVTFGEGTTDEMMLVFFAYMPYQTNDEYLIIDNRIIPKGATTFCDYQNVELETIKGSGYTYQWYMDGVAIAGATAYNVFANMSGNYTVRITLGPNTTLSDPVQVIVNPSPSAVILTPSNTVIPNGGTILLEAQTGAGYNYQWYLDGVAINGATSSTFDAPYFGNYTLEVFNGCYAISEQITLSGGIAGINENNSSSFSMYPNPSENKISIVRSDVTDALIIECSDMNGKVLSQVSFDAINQSVDISELESGVYFISVKSTEAIVWKKKFIKL